MSGLNRVDLIGHLGADPEVRAMPSGDSVANLSLATSETWKDKQTGEKKEKTEWHRVAIFGKLADIAGQYLRKGSQVYISGQLQTRKWQDNTGQDRYTTEVVVRGFGGSMQMLDKKGDSPGQGGYASAPQQQSPGQRATQANMAAQAPAGGGADFDADVPFRGYLKNAEYLL